MTDMDRLRATLAHHGFHIAAAFIEIHARFAGEQLATWRDYPRCMDRFPKIITGRRI